MILLTNVRLINWYGFNNITAPIGFFTLIAGKNGNGKSVLLDAIKYAAFGDTVFNKSQSEGKTKRTISSYTRGLLDATAKTYMRPADKYPNVFCHIALEFYDHILKKYFILGCIIETKSSDVNQTYRYLMDKTKLSDVEHLYEEEGVKKPYHSNGFQKEYGVTLFNSEQGVVRFMQMLGLKLSSSQTRTYVRKLRGIMTYNPNDKIDDFIKKNVLENQKVDFSKLIEAKENIERLNETFTTIQAEINELEQILILFDKYESEKTRLLIDDIKIVYRRIMMLKQELKELALGQELAEKELQKTEEALKDISQREADENSKLNRVTASLIEMECMVLINQEEERLGELTKSQEKLSIEKNRLDDFQTKVSEIIFVLEARNRTIVNKKVLVSMTAKEYSFADKEMAVKNLKEAVDEEFEVYINEISGIRHTLSEIEKQISNQNNILDDCQKNKNAFSHIVEYVNLKNEINRELKKRGISSEAKFACEYVISLKDESWRDAIEAFLGKKRYPILVDPEYYDIADDILNHSNYRYAHLFNTKLLMKKEIETTADSVVRFLEIKNPVAQKYFDYRLGRIKAVSLNEVKNYENAISKEGRVSVSMDGYFLRFDRIRFYYLGQETFELNRIRAEKEIKKLKNEKGELLNQKQEFENNKNRLKSIRDLFKDYQYDAYQKHNEIINKINDTEKTLKKLRDAQKDNLEFIQLSQMKTDLINMLGDLVKERTELFVKQNEFKRQIERSIDDIEAKEKNLSEAESSFKEYQINEYTAVQKATAAYDKYVAVGSKGSGGLVSADTRRRIQDEIKSNESQILVNQGLYNGKRAEENKLQTGVDHRLIYEKRKNKIWMDDLQEIKTTLVEQTRRYEDIFKTEFVLTISKSCAKSLEELKLLNAELAKLKFSTRYQFDVHYLKDMSDHAKVIEYAKYLEEREQFNGTDGQMIFGAFNSFTDEDAERLDKDIKKIINRIILKNNTEEIEKFADYRNYMTYEILLSNETLRNAKLSRQTGYNSGAEVQIPYLLILSSALLMIYNEKSNCARLVFIDEPFTRMDPGNVKLMLDFLKKQNLQVIFCAPDKTESIGDECEVILPVLKVKADNMQLGVVKFHEEKCYAAI